MRTLVGLGLAVGLAGCGGLYYRDTRPELTVDQVVAMNGAGVDESVILAKVETSRVPGGPLKAGDIVSLKEKGLPDKVLEALVEASAEPPPAVYRSYYGSPYYDFWYPYGYYPWYYGPRYSFSVGYGSPYYPYYYRYPYRYGGYRTYRSYPHYGGSRTYRSAPVK